MARHHKWLPSGDYDQTCEKCGLRRVDTKEGWFYAWPDGRTEERTEEQRVPPCEDADAQPKTKTGKDWWAYD